MSGERGQALVEAIVAVPVGLACALLIVDGGIVVRDRIAVSQAATQAARASIEGRDVRDAARRALPDSLRNELRVDVDGSTISVHATSRPALVSSVGIEVAQRSSVEVDA